MSFRYQEEPEERLFTAALALSAEERKDFVRKSAGNDEALYDGVMALLAGYEEAGGDEASATMGSASARQKWATSTEEPGSVIGSFTLVRMIGEGGMGTVWEAEQSEPIKRRVALKVIKLGMDTAEVVQRFERERQTLAVMEHPNIAQVFEAGATELGRPYFVMEFVAGLPISDYCARESLSIDDRLGVMLDACAGIEHAHRKGVIHRDLKPTNILVSREGALKIIDFGIAKAATTDVSTLFTQTQQMLGTPAYMSPEQASGSVAAIDTRSDVYSLGVVLYELLAGAPPFDPDRLASTGLAEMQQILREEEPPKPSTRQTSLQAKPEVKVRTPDFENDLDWVVMKALSKEPDRRYESATALARDLQRYLDGEVVEAVPPSITYRVSRFAKRRRGLLLGMAGAFAALIVGLTLRGLLDPSEAFDFKGVVTPVSVISNTTDEEGPAVGLIDGSGLNGIPTGDNLPDISHQFALAENSWVTLRYRPDYYEAIKETPSLEFELPKTTEITGFAYWGYVLLRYGPDFGHEPKTFRFTFLDRKGKMIGQPVTRETLVPTRRAVRVIGLPRTRGVRSVRVDILDNHYPFSGGGRVAMGEVRFLSNEAPPTLFQTPKEASPIPTAAFAARLMTCQELASDLIVNHSTQATLQAGVPPDSADTALTVNGRPLSQYKGVLIPSAEWREDWDVIIRAPGELSHAPEVVFDPPFPAGIWLPSNAAERNREVAYCGTAFIYFSFAAGWPGGHLTEELRHLHKGNAARDFDIQPLDDGLLEVRDPNYAFTPEDAALFVVSSSNLTSPEIVSTNETEDGDGWHIRSANGFSGRSEFSSLSFVCVPFSTTGMMLGQIDRDGSTVRSGTLPFTCAWNDAAKRYEIQSDSYPDLSQGAVIANAHDPRDCHFTWELSADLSTLYLHPERLPLENEHAQDCGFVFAYLSNDADVEMGKPSILEKEKSKERLRQRSETVRRRDALRDALSKASLVKPTAVISSTATEPAADDYPASNLIDGSGLGSQLEMAEAALNTIHALSDGRNSWVTNDNLPDYFEGPTALPPPVLTFTLEQPTEISAFLYWGYRFSGTNLAYGNEPSRMRFTFFDDAAQRLGAPVERAVTEATGLQARVLSLPPTPNVKVITLEILDNIEHPSGGDRVGMGEVRFLSGYQQPLP